MYKRERVFLHIIIKIIKVILFKICFYFSIDIVSLLIDNNAHQYFTYIFRAHV